MDVKEKLQDPSQRNFKYIDIIMLVYVLVLVLSNIASSAKIIDWGIRIGPLPLSFDAGTLLFPISYVIGDVMTEFTVSNEPAASFGLGSVRWSSAHSFSD